MFFNALETFMDVLQCSLRAFLRCFLQIATALVFLAACTDDNSYNFNSVAEPDSSSAVNGDTVSQLFSKGPIMITEVDPLNSVYEDHEGGDAAWVELFNLADTAVNLEGMMLSDDSLNLNKWTFGHAVVPPHSYMLVFLSGKDLSDYLLPSDSTDMLTSSCWTWTDSQNDPPGTSYAEPIDGQRKFCFQENNVRKFGTKMKFGENEELGWSSISLFVTIASEEQPRDLKTANELLLSGYITKGRVVSLRLAQPGVEDWKGYEVTFVGTGLDSSVYRAPLPVGKTLPDLSAIYGTRVSPESHEVREVEMKIHSYVVRNRGHEPHTNFKAKKQGGVLYLSHPENGVEHFVRYPKAVTGLSWTFGTNSSGVAAWGYGKPSPYGYTVGAVEADVSQAPSGELPPSGFYAAPFSISFVPEDSVRCAVGGRAPLITDPKIEKLSIAETEVIRCASYRAESMPSAVESRTYVFDKQPSIATVFVMGDPGSLFDPDSGIYMEGPDAWAQEPHFGANYWMDKEVPIAVELFEPGKPAPAFSENAGLKIFGNYSRTNDKKSVSITFREKYGNKRLDYKLFPDYPELKRFKVFLLRSNGSNAYSDYIRDRLASSISEGLDVDYQRSRAAVVYYNGEYYGLHNIRERSTEYYFETHYGYDPDDIDLLKADNQATSGSPYDYMALMDWLGTNHLDSDENYAYVAERVDVSNFMNYVQTEMFADNRDWPGNNLKKWRVESKKTPWKWFLYDLDFGFGSGMSEFNNNIFEFATAEDGPTWPNGPEYTLLLRRLFENDNFRRAFVNRMSVLLKMNFSSSRVIARIDSMMNEIETEVPRDQERWFRSSSYMDMQLSNIRDFAETRPGVVYDELQEFFALGDTVSTRLCTKGGAGVILVDGLRLDRNDMTIPFFKDHPVKLKAVPQEGSVFVGWDDGVTSAEREIIPEKGTTFTAQFR